MKIILHCGTAKTGTTSLQGCLNEFRQALAEHGVLYPDPMFGLNSHLGLIARFVGKNRVSKGISQGLGGEKMAVKNGHIFFDALCAEVAKTKPDLIVLSCEYLFQSLNAAELRDMAEALDALGGTVSPVVYLREPASWYASACQQNVKMGRSLKGPGTQEIRKSLELLGSVFGPVTMRAFQRDAMEGGEIVTDFVTHAMQRPDLLVHMKPADRNASISAEACAIIEIYRQHMASDRVGLAHPGTRKLINRIAAIEAAGEGPARPVLRPEVARQVRLSSVDYTWLRDVHGITFPEYEAAIAAGGSDEEAAVTDESPPTIDMLFELDTTRRDRILGHLLQSAVDGIGPKARRAEASKADRRPDAPLQERRERRAKRRARTQE